MNKKFKILNYKDLLIHDKYKNNSVIMVSQPWSAIFVFLVNCVIKQRVRRVASSSSVTPTQCAWTMIKGRKLFMLKI